jgi:hypothetical protein
MAPTEEEMIVKAFKKWCRDRKCKPIAVDAMTFFLSLGVHADEWENVLGVLRKRGLIKGPPYGGRKG